MNTVEHVAAQNLTSPSTSKIVRFTRLEGTSSQGKSVTLDANGRLVKISPAKLHHAIYHELTVTCPEDLASYLASWRQNDVLMTGVCISGAPIGTQVVKKDRLRPGTIARTKEYFGWPSGSCLVGLDFDLNCPVALALVKEAGGLRRAILAAVPLIGEFAGVWACSGGSGIWNKRTGEKFGVSGLHCFLLCENSDGLVEFRDYINARLKLAGYIFPFISQPGVAFSRSPLDTRASSNPVRLFYRAPASFEHSDLGYMAGVRTPLVQHGRWFNAARDLPVLSLEERARVRQIDAEIIASVDGDAKSIRRDFHARRGTRNPSSAIRRGADGVPVIPIGADAPLKLDDGRIVRAGALLAEVLSDPARFRDQKNKITMADPEEHDYGAGHNLAVLRVPPSGHISIFSLAHGDQIFEFEITTDDVRALLKEKNG